MNVLVTGATGFIGRRLCVELATRGHRLTVLSRSPESARRHGPPFENAHAWEPTAGRPPAVSLDGCDAVVHLAGEPVAGRWSAEKRRAIWDSRVLGTRHLVDAIASGTNRPSALISASAIGFYGERGDETLDESSEPGAGFLADLCRLWEDEAERAEGHGVRVVRLRVGIVLGPEGGALREMLPMYRKGLGGRLGSGRQWWSWIHCDDVVSLIAHALESEAHGPVNATAPAPERQRDVARSLGRALRRPAVLPAPSFALKLALGGFSEELLGSKRVLPRRATEDLGYTFRHPHLDGALAHLLGTPEDSD